MKKVNLKGKLSLGKETVSKLNDASLKMIVGGGITAACDDTQQNTCRHYPTTPLVCTK
jgi:hypothetical protein